MKIRNGFVSNSSSSSFVVSANKLSRRDLDLLLEYPTTENADDWNIYLDEDLLTVRGFTIMDNCGLSDYLKDNNIKCDDFLWESY